MIEAPVGVAPTKQSIKRSLPGRCGGSLTPLTDAAYMCYQIAQTGSLRLRARKADNCGGWLVGASQFAFASDASAAIFSYKRSTKWSILRINEGAMQHS